MTGETLFVFLLLAATIVLFASELLRLDVVAVLVVLILMLSQVLSPTEALAGFGDPLVLLIAGLFVVGEGLFRTGVAFRISTWVTKVAGTSETRLLVMLMLVVAGLSAFMSSTGTVAIFIPVAINLAAKVKSSPAKQVGIEVSCYQGTKHSLGTQLVDQGVSLEILAAIYGHKSTQTTKRYAKVSQKRLKEIWGDRQ
jgi:di/tricarboxylate transporter